MRKNQRTWLLVAALLSGLCLLVAGVIQSQQVGAAAASDATVRLVTQGQARTNAPIEVRLVANNVTNLAGFQAQVNYDPGLMRLTGALISDDLARGGRDVMRVGPVWRDGALGLGAVTCPVSKCSDTSGKQTQRMTTGLNGQVELGTVRFYIEKPGAYTLHLSDVQLVDPQGNVLPFSAADVTLNVVAQ